MHRDEYRSRRRRKKKKKKSIWTPILFLLVLVLISIIGFMGYRNFVESKKVIIKEVDLSDKAAAMCLVWLGQIDDNQLSYEDVKLCMEGVTIPVTYSPTGKRCVYTQSIQETDYEASLEKAKGGLKKAYILTVKNRLEADEYEGEITDELIEELMQKAYGISIDVYLEQCDIQILPAFEKLSEEYSGEVEDVK